MASRNMEIAAEAY